MALVTSSIFLDILLAIFPLLYFVYWYITHNDDYWDKRGVPNDKGKSGMVKNLLGAQSQHEMFSELYNKFPGNKYIGTFQVNKPMLVVRDPDLIHKILIEDFIHFHDRGGFGIPTNEPLAKNLFALKGQMWRALRYKLTPTFTTGKLKMMLEQISKCGDNLIAKLKNLTDEGEAFESKDVMLEFTLDVIASCAFGFQFEPNSPEFNIFKSKVSKIFDSSFTSIFKTIFVIKFPRLAKKFSLSIFSSDSSNYLLNFTRQTIKHRRENKIKRNDYLQLLLTLQEQEESGKERIPTLSDATEDDDVIDQMCYAEQNGKPPTENIKLMTEDTICANSTIFLIAGSDSSAITMSFILFNLTQHPEVQQRLQTEVDEVLKQHGAWSYKAIKDLTYMDQVVQGGVLKMAFVTSSLLLDLLLALFSIMYFIYWYVTHNDDYWDKRGVPNIKNRGDLIKNLLGIQSQHEIVSEMYNKFPDTKLLGSFQVNKPVLMVCDPDLIQKVLIKDFVHFQDRGGMRPSSKEPLSRNLFGLCGQIWRALRYKLTPTFTTGKLRIMLEQISKSGDNLMEKLQTIASEGNSFESKEVMNEFTLDVISSCAFGVQFKPNSPEFNTFKSTVHKMFNFSFISILRALITTTLPKFAELISLTAFPKDASDYFLNFTKSTIKYRKENNIKRNDYLQLLLTLKEQEDSGKEMISSSSDLTEDDAVIDQMRYTEQKGQTTTTNIKLMTEDAICANSFIFLTAGSESTANTISFTLLNLTQHPDIQKRVQEEVDSVLKQHGRWNYDALRDLTYMDQVIQAMRFAVMEVKACLAKIMSEYTVSLSPKTKTPIQMKKRAFFPEVDGGIWLSLNKRKESK